MAGSEANHSARSRPQTRRLHRLQSFSIITFDAIAEIQSILSPRDDGVLDRDEIIYRAF
jgi:hypothetical protein